MKELKIIETLNINNPIPFQAFAFDGKNYFLCGENKKVIYIYDCNFKMINCYHTANEYGSICYDGNHDCLWAIPKTHCNVIIKLNKNLQEIGYITLPKCDIDLSIITSMSFCCLTDNIILSTQNKIVKISTINNCIHEIFTIDNICKVICVSPGYIIITEKEDLQLITIYNSNFEVTYQACIEKTLMLCDAILNVCCKTDTNLLLLMKNNYGCNNIYNVTIKHCDYGYDLDKCNFCICDFEKENAKPCEQICFNDYLESIALIQAALSHIINAEGEKIQKILATTDNIDEILCVNKEVNKTIVNITHLEQVLYDSLLVSIEKCSCACDCNCSCNCNCECNCNFESNCCKCADEMNKCICDVDGGNLN